MKLNQSLNTLILNTGKDTANVKSKVKIFFYKNDLISISLQLSQDKGSLILKCRNLIMKDKSETLTNKLGVNLLDQLDVKYDNSIGDSTSEIIKAWVIKQLGSDGQEFITGLENYLRQTIQSGHIDVVSLKDAVADTVQPPIFEPVVLDAVMNKDDQTYSVQTMSKAREEEIIAKIKKDFRALSFYAE